MLSPRCLLESTPTPAYTQITTIDGIQYGRPSRSEIVGNHVILSVDTARLDEAWRVGETYLERLAENGYKEQPIEHNYILPGGRQTPWALRRKFDGGQYAAFGRQLSATFLSGQQTTPVKPAYVGVSTAPGAAPRLCMGDGAERFAWMRDAGRTRVGILVGEHSVGVFEKWLGAERTDGPPTPSTAAVTVATAVADHVRAGDPTAVGVDVTRIAGVVQRRMDAFLPVVHPVPVSKTFDEVAAPRGGEAPVLAGISITFQTARAAASFIREFVARNGDNEENVRDLIDTRKWSTDSNETAEIADNVIAEMEHGSEVAAQRWWLDERQLSDPQAVPQAAVYPIPLNGTIDDRLTAVIEKKRVAIAAVDPNARLIDFHLDEIDRWRSGAKASPGLSPLGDRYALEMREGVKHHEAEIEKLRGRTITGRDRLDGAHQAIYDLFANHPDRVPPLRPVSNGLFPITPKALVMMFPRRQHPEVAPVIHTPPSGISRALSWEDPAQARKLINALLEDKIIEVGERNRAGALVGFLLTARAPDARGVQ